MNRYLISKGWEGFADRLQTLSHCVNMALLYNRVICVDWRDRIWSGGDEGFHTYFDLVDLPYVESVDLIPANLQVFPSFWNNGLGLATDDWVYKLKDDLVLDPQKGRHFEPIWVHSGIGYRAFDFTVLVQHLRITPKVAMLVRPLLDQVGNQLPVVHLRGTDRIFSEERWRDLRLTAPVAYVITDDSSLASRWMQESPESKLVSDTLVEGKGGGHKLAETPLLALGFSKFKMNIRLLADFLIIARAKDAYGLNEQSLFFKMARIFGNCGGVSALFSAVPEVVVLDGAMVRPHGGHFDTKKAGP